MTVRELKNIVNGVSEDELDTKISCYFNSEGGGERVYDEPILDKFLSFKGELVMALTLCKEEKDFDETDLFTAWNDSLFEG